MRSVYLSVGRFEEDDDRHEAYAEQLAEYARRLRAGEGIEYDDSELERLRQQRDAMLAVPASAVFGVLARAFAPGCLFVAILYLILLLLGVFG